MIARSLTSVCVTEQDVHEFQQLCRGHLGLCLDPKEAVEQAYALLTFIDIARRHAARDEVPADKNRVTRL